MRSIVLVFLFLFCTALSAQNTIESRFSVPEGYQRTGAAENSFTHYLRNLPLKPPGTEVLHYDGSVKRNYDVYEAVVDLPIGKKNLHQCADAVMRLRAEFLFQQKRFNEIKFNFTNGMAVPYSKWMQGYRVAVLGNISKWVNTGKAINPGDRARSSRDSAAVYNNFWNYMELIFNYAGTASLAKELPKQSDDSLNVGDIFIQGGFPGHAVIVVDMATHKQTGEKLFLLAQSYMPAQEIQVLMNPKGGARAPWYSEKEMYPLVTPEWTFQKGDLRTWR